jgi:hypothetical protein
MVNEWEAQNILTSSITKVFLGLFTMDSDHWYFNPQNMGLKHTFFAWFRVNYPQNIDGKQMGGQKYIN